MKYKKGEIEKLIIKYAKEDKSSTEIGMILRDQYGIPLTKSITGKTISDIMKENKIYPKFPEDLFNFFKQAINLRNHLAKNKKDYTSKRGLELLFMTKLKFDIKKLPMIIELEVKGKIKEYVVKSNKDKTGIFLNLKEQYWKINLII